MAKYHLFLASHIYTREKPLLRIDGLYMRTFDTPQEAWDYFGSDHFSRDSVMMLVTTDESGNLVFFGESSEEYELDDRQLKRTVRRGWIKPDSTFLECERFVQHKTTHLQEKWQREYEGDE